VVSTVATPGEWQCKIRTGGVRRLAVTNGPNIFQMLLVTPAPITGRDNFTPQDKNKSNTTQIKLKPRLVASYEVIQYCIPLSCVIVLAILETHHPGYRALRHAATGSSVKLKCLTALTTRNAVL